MLMRIGGAMMSVGFACKALLIAARTVGEMYFPHREAAQSLHYASLPEVRPHLLVHYKGL
jgi:hypothetical protein